jgi:hypothetical protein
MSASEFNAMASEPCLEGGVVVAALERIVAPQVAEVELGACFDLAHFYLIRPIRPHVEVLERQIGDEAFLAQHEGERRQAGCPDDRTWTTNLPEFPRYGQAPMQPVGRSKHGPVIN